MEFHHTKPKGVIEIIKPQKSESEINRILQTYGNVLYRTAYLLLGNPHDVQDVLQEVLLRYMEKAPAFTSSDHEKAWLLRVTSNCCKDCLRFRKRHSYIELEQIQEFFRHRRTNIYFRSSMPCRLSGKPYYCCITLKVIRSKKSQKLPVCRKAP